MKPARVLTALVIPMLVALLLAGCGDDGALTKSQYEHQVGSVNRQVTKDIDKLDAGPPSGTDIDAARAAIDRAASKLDDIEPPHEVQQLHEDYVKELHAESSILKRARPLFLEVAKDPTLSSKDQASMQQVQSDFEDVSKEMSRIQKGYDKRGYDVGLDA
jgi:hypothetical protein